MDGLIGRIEIPRLLFSAVVAEGIDRATLRHAVGHIPGTALPGEPGNVGLAGHRDTFFRALKDLRTGDEIQFSTPGGDFKYVVESLIIVEPDNVGVLAPSSENVLTLVTCYPFFYIGAAPKRWIVRARQVSPQTRAAIKCGMMKTVGEDRSLGVSLKHATVVPAARILVIEDNGSDVFLLERALNKQDLRFELIHLLDGGQALAFIRRQGAYADAAIPNLILVDLNLSKYTGEDILREIRNAGHLGGVPVCVWSSSRSRRDEALLKQLGVSQFITKPSGLDQFMDIGRILKDAVASVSDTRAGVARAECTELRPALTEAGRRSPLIATIFHWKQTTYRILPVPPFWLYLRRPGRSSVSRAESGTARAVCKVRPSPVITPCSARKVMVRVAKKTGKRRPGGVARSARTPDAPRAKRRATPPGKTAAA